MTEDVKVYQYQYIVNIESQVADQVEVNVYQYQQIVNIEEDS